MKHLKQAWLFPGQGSQYTEHLQNLIDHPVVDATLAEASEFLGEDVRELDHERALASTKNVQVTMLTAGVATARAMLTEGARPDFVAGHSVGAFAAAVISNVMTFQEALHIVRLRGELMESLQDENYGMAVVVGLTEQQLLEIVEKLHTAEHPVFVSNRNAPRQLTLSGHKEAMQRVLYEVQGKGASTAKLLNVSTPSHSPLFDSVQQELLREMKKFQFKRPLYPFVSNRHARLLRQEGAIMTDLAESIALPVKWHDATTVLYENGVRLFIEIPPGDVLKKLAQVAFPEASSYSIERNGFNDCLYVSTKKGV